MADGPAQEPASKKDVVVPKPAPAPAPADAKAADAKDSDAEKDSSGANDASGASGSIPAAPSGSNPAGPSGSSPASRSSTSGPDPLVGRVINDRFRIVSQIARGGMGKVYRAEQAPLGREVALKVLNPNYSGDNDPEFHKRFFLEASTCSKLTHPNTVTIFDYGRTDDDIYYIAMELLEGRTLHRALREEGPFGPERALHIARQICRSLREAHGLGVIHRDLKPANVYLVRHGDENDFAKVLDFGLVKNVDDKGEDLTQTGLFMGSPKYMSPEQIRGERADARADIYSLGVILYEMLTGKVPFDRPNSVNILMAHVHEPPPAFTDINPNVSVPPALEMLVMKALSKQPQDRFSSMDDLLGAMKAVADGRGDLYMSGEVTNVGAVGATGRHGALSRSGEVPSLTPSGVVAAPGVTAPNSGATKVSVPPSVRPSEAPPPSRTPLIAAGVIGLVLVVGIGVYLSNGTTPPPSSTVAGHDDGTAPPPSSTLTVEPPPSTTVAPIHTLVSLQSTPSGAMVSVGEREYGPTPTDVEWTGDDAARGREVTFLFHLAGHRDYSVIRTITGDTLAVSATLDALPTDRPFRPRPPRRPEGDDGTAPVGPVKGYKLDPY